MKLPFDPNRIFYPFLPLILISVVIPLYFLTQGGVGVLDFVVTGVCFFLFDNLGVQIGVHKHLCHKAFSTSSVWRRTLAAFSVLSGQGSPLVWVAVHMGSHHPHSDTERDIHSPKKGVWFAFLAWYWRCDKALIQFAVAREYLKDHFLVFLHRNHTVILIGFWLALFLFGGTRALVFAGLLPAALSIIFAGFVNAFMHSKGKLSRILFLKYQNHPGDSTYNSVWLGFFTMGLGLHNNHHHDSKTSSYHSRWFEIDLSRWVIPLISRKN